MWEDIVVHDPYGMCFAFQYLIDRDEYLPWAYGVSGILMDRCRYALPWCGTVAQFEADTSEQYDNTAETDVVVSSYYGTFVADRCAHKDAVRQRYNWRRSFTWKQDSSCPEPSAAMRNRKRGWTDSGCWIPDWACPC